jgi:peptidoglycan/LPS O-acetylase OafA/YrhL
LVAYRPNPGPRFTGLLRIGPLVALVALFVVFTGRVSLPLDQTRLVTALLTASVILAIALQPYGPAARILAWRPLAFVGLVSYGLYLWHLIVFRLFKQHVHIVTMGEKLLWAPAMLALTAVLTIASYYLVEKPCNALKDRLPATYSR